MIDLKTFIEGYKTSEVEYGDKRWKFREPKIKDSDLQIFEMLEKNCIEWDFKEFKDLIDNELTYANQKDLIENILKDLGLA